MLTLVNDTPKDIRDRIKIFEDACAELGDEHPLVKEYWGVVNVDLDITQNLIAYLKLRIITAALNEGWKPQFSGSEIRYYPWFLRDSKGRIHFHMIDSVGLSISHCDAQLVFKSKLLAEYAGKQFIDIYKDFCYGRNKL